MDETKFSVELDTLLDEGLLGVILELEELLSSRDGILKHGPRYWNTLSDREHMSKLKGHLEAYCDGQDEDEDSGMPILLHVIARAVMIRALEKHPHPL